MEAKECLHEYRLSRYVAPIPFLRLGSQLIDKIVYVNAWRGLSRARVTVNLGVCKCFFVSFVDRVLSRGEALFGHCTNNIYVCSAAHGDEIP